MFFIDLGAILGPKIHQKSIKNGVEKTTGNKTGKYVRFLHLGGSIGGLAAVTGRGGKVNLPGTE